ncbi:trehalose synthase [bacterium]|nr:MAG: trehalose synthase [bacterium]
MIDDLWFKNAVVYSLDLDTFMDGDGDGVGDFSGLNRRLDYLHSLGVDTLWLAPFQPSPNRDNGYDITDYYGVDPRHGSSGDFVEFVQRAKSLGIRVIVDLVVNHTSDRHPWFQQARRDENSRYRDWYVWSKKKPPRAHEGIVYPGTQTTTWTFDPLAKAYYHHRFHDFQPDLNIDNPEVRREIHRIMGYWLELGVAGFRVDSLPFVIESPPIGSGRPRQRFDVLALLREGLQWRAGNTVLLGEANVLPKESERYFGKQGDGIHLMLNFHVNQHLFLALANADARPLAKALLATRDVPFGAQWAQFLRNHDELDLARLAERDRARVIERFAPDPDMQLYERGLRRRLAPMLGDRRHLELAYSLLFALPGAQVIRYGDEIGMGDDLAQPEREAVRTPMQWSADRNAGFSTAKRIVQPVIRKGPYGYEHVNVEAQRRDPGSLLNWTAQLIRLRKECPEIGWGRLEPVATGNHSVIGFSYEWRDNRIVLLHNLADRPVDIRMRLPEVRHLTNLMSAADDRTSPNGVFRMTLEELGYRWLRCGTRAYGSSPAATAMV